MSVCIIPNCYRKAAATEPFCSEHRDKPRATDLEARIERLRRIVHRYGDRVPMATCHRADWQQEIDDAMEWVGDNPETEK